MKYYVNNGSIYYVAKIYLWAEVAISEITLTMPKQGGNIMSDNIIIDISKKDKAAVLAALYNHARPQGMGFFQYDPTPMSDEQAREILKNGTYFDYVRGRVMKINLECDTLNPWLYDRDNGDGAAAKAISTIPDC